MCGVAACTEFTMLVGQCIAAGRCSCSCVCAALISMPFGGRWTDARRDGAVWMVNTYSPVNRPDNRLQEGATERTARHWHAAPRSSTNAPLVTENPPPPTLRRRLDPILRRECDLTNSDFPSNIQRAPLSIPPPPHSPINDQ